MGGIWAFIKKNFLLLLLLVFAVVGYMNACNNNKRITRAINKLENADKLLDSAKGILASAAGKMDSAQFYVNSSMAILDKASGSMNELKGINEGALRNIHISLDNVNNIDKTKKGNEEVFLRQLMILNAEISDLQNKIKNAQAKQ